MTGQRYCFLSPLLCVYLINDYAYYYCLLLELQLSLKEDIVIQACQVFVDPYEEVDELVSKLIQGS